MASMQSQLLQYAENRLAPEGAVVYSTCSIEPEENRGVVAGFLASSHGFTLSPPDSAAPPEAVSPEGFLELLGPDTGSDGVFAARFEKRSVRVAT